MTVWALLLVHLCIAGMTGPIIVMARNDSLMTGIPSTVASPFSVNLRSCGLFHCVTESSDILDPADSGCPARDRLVYTARGATVVVTLVVFTAYVIHVVQASGRAGCLPRAARPLALYGHVAASIFAVLAAFSMGFVYNATLCSITLVEVSKIGYGVVVMACVAGTELLAYCIYAAHPVAGIDDILLLRYEEISQSAGSHRGDAEDSGASRNTNTWKASRGSASGSSGGAAVAVAVEVTGTLQYPPGAA